MSRRRLTRRVVLGAGALALLGGCVSLPTDGNVQTGLEGPPPDSGLEIVAPGPSQDASPELIVEGFLLASSLGLSDDFSRAHEFMTTAGASQWDALGGVTVYSDTVPVVIERGDESDDGQTVPVTVTVPVAATIAGDGTYTAASPGTTQSFTFDLVRIVGDQWRISQLDAGVLMSEVTFGTQYRDVSVYFLSGDAEPLLVPDLRWVPRSASVLGSVRALLDGPADWLAAPAVVTAFPGGTELAIEGVEIDDRVATVSLSSEFLSASAADRAYAQAQLEATLGQLGQISRVEISVEGNVLTVDESLAVVAATPVPARGPTVLTEDGFATLSGDSPTLVDGAQPPSAEIGQVALPYRSGPAVGLVDSSALVAFELAAAEPTTLSAPGGRLLAPSYDERGWVWTGPTGPGANTGELTVVDPVQGTVASVAAPDLSGADVVAIRVSREGSRIAYALRTDDAVTVYVAAIERDGDGVPVEISPGRSVSAPLAVVRDLVWVDDVQLGVLGATESTITVLLVAVGGQTVPLPSIEGAVAIAAGDGPRELYLVTTGGDLYGRSGNGWRSIAGGVADPVFAG